MNNSQGQNIKVLNKVEQILDLFSIEEPKLTLNQICERIDIQKTTVFRILNSLIDIGFIEKDSQSKQYILGVGILKYSSLVLHHLELRRMGAKYTEKLAREFDISSGIGILRDNEIVIIDIKNYNSSQAPSTNLGFRDPVYCTAIGKMFLASKQKDEILDILSTEMPLKKYTQKTVTDTDKLLIDIETYRKNGYAIDNEEYVDGLRCLAVPIFDHTNQMVAALMVSTMSKMPIEEFISNVLPKSFVAAADLSKEIRCMNYIARIEALKNREF